MQILDQKYVYVNDFENDFNFGANFSNKLYFYNGQMDKVYFIYIDEAMMHCLTILTKIYTV